MHDGDILGKQHLIDSMFLGGIEPRKTDWVKGEFLGLAAVVEEVAQLCEAIALGLCDFVNSL